MQYEKFGKIYEVIANFQRWAVTQAEVDACTRLDLHPHIVYDFRDKNIVYFNAETRRFACTCKESAAPTCWHRRAASVVARDHEKKVRQS